MNSRRSGNFGSHNPFGDIGIYKDTQPSQPFGNLGDINGKKVSFIEGKVYPSTEVPGILSKRQRERPRITPAEMKAMCAKFKDLPSEKKPRLRFEHNLDPRKELGVIHDIWYNEKDKWMYMNAGIYEKNKNVVSQLLREGIFRKGISLSYFAKGQYKDFIEISLVDNPDFEGASVEYFHSNSDNSENLIVWPLSTGTFFPPNYLDYMAQPQQQQQPQSSGAPEAHELDQHYQRLPNGVMVVRDASKVQAIQQLAIARGIDPSMVVYQDMAGLENMSEDQRTAFLAATLAENQRLAQETQRQNAERQQQAIQTTFSEIRPVIDFATGILPEGDRDTIGQALAVSMATNPQMRAMGDLFEARMHEFNQLRQENEMLKKQQSSPFQYGTQNSQVAVPSMQSSLQTNMFTPSPSYQQPGVFAHSTSGPQQFPVSYDPTAGAPVSVAGVPFPALATGMSMSDMWNQMSQSLRASQAQQQSTQLPQVHQHSAGQGQNSAKRPERPAVLDQYNFEGFELFPQKAGDAASQPSASTDIAVFAHSGASPAVDPKRRRVLPGSPIVDSPPGGYLSTLTKSSTNEDVLRANLAAICTGERFIGKVPRDFLTENLFTRFPQVFTAIASNMVDGHVIDNSNAGVFGYEQSPNDRIVQRIKSRGLEHKYLVKNGEFESRSNAYFGTSS